MNLLTMELQTSDNRALLTFANRGMPNWLRAIIVALVVLGEFVALGYGFDWLRSENVLRDWHIALIGTLIVGSFVFFVLWHTWKPAAPALDPGSGESERVVRASGEPDARVRRQRILVRVLVGFLTVLVSMWMWRNTRTILQVVGFWASPILFLAAFVKTLELSGRLLWRMLGDR